MVETNSFHTLKVSIIPVKGFQHYGNQENDWIGDSFY